MQHLHRASFKQLIVGAQPTCFFFFFLDSSALQFIHTATSHMANRPFISWHGRQIASFALRPPASSPTPYLSPVPGMHK